ncbi:hypothetical protein [Actinophytocola sediminis]
MNAWTRDDVDHELDRLAADCDTIAQSLVEMDGHPGHRLLRGAALSGLTARRWAETSTAMTTLWEQYSTYRGLVEHAKATRARRGRLSEEDLAELSSLLTGHVVELDSEHVPIERRGLTGAAVVTERITMAELLARMKQTFATVIDVLATAESAWSAAIGRLDPLTDELRAVSILAESVAAGDQATTHRLDRLRRELDDARERVVTDPLSVAADDPLPRLATELDALRDHLGRTAAVRDSFDARLADIDRVCADIEAAEATARQIWAAVVQKIANPGLPAPTTTGSARLRTEVDALTSRRATGRWGELGAEADRLDQAAADILEEVRRSLRTIRGLLDRRAELRGRLEAYQVKAARLGYAEDLALQESHTAAHQLLFTAPCDLAAATRALNRYQQALQERERPPEEATR